MYTNLLLATDGSKLSDPAVAHAIGLASKLGAKLNCLYVSSEYPDTMVLDGGSVASITHSAYAAAAAAAAGAQSKLPVIVAR